MVQKKIEMESVYEIRVEELTKKNALEIQAMIIKSKAKIATEEKRHAGLIKETKEAAARWGELSIFISLVKYRLVKWMYSYLVD